MISNSWTSPARSWIFAISPTSYPQASATLSVMMTSPVLRSASSRYPIETAISGSIPYTYKLSIFTYAYSPSMSEYIESLTPLSLNALYSGRFSGSLDTSQTFMLTPRSASPLIRLKRSFIRFFSVLARSKQNIAESAQKKIEKITRSDLKGFPNVFLITVFKIILILPFLP